jgi:hypothetical protein
VVGLRLCIGLEVVVDSVVLCYKLGNMRLYSGIVDFLLQEVLSGGEKECLLGTGTEWIVGDTAIA